jgi:uncharacterized metal-binding protein YceD (DUF177 family)
MMADAMPEFSRVVRLDQVGPQPFRQRIEATPDERERLSRRFDLLSLDRLTATVDLYRQSGGGIRLEAAFEADFVQSCVVTLEPVAGVISDRFLLVYGPPEMESREIASGGDEAAFEPLVGDAIDIGEAVAQELSLALPPFPRDSAASMDIEFAEMPGAGSFEPLASLRRPTES